MNKSVQLAIRMTPEVRDLVERAAKTERRTMSSYMEMAIFRALFEDGYMPDAVEPGRGALEPRQATKKRGK